MPKKLLLWCEHATHTSPLQYALKQISSYRVITIYGEVVDDIPECQVALLDMPCGTVAGRLSILRRQYAEIKILALVPFGDTAALDACLAAGVDEVLDKPVAQARLALSLHNLFKLYTLEEKLLNYISRPNQTTRPTMRASRDSHS